jgi:hypothetical protein
VVKESPDQFQVQVLSDLIIQAEDFMVAQVQENLIGTYIE